MLPRENADISKRTLMKRKIERGNEVKSVIQTKVTTKIESLAKIPTKEMKRKEFELMKKENKKPQTRSIEHLAPSTPELENRSIGSIFADTVTSALAQCGKEDKILNKYSDSCEKFPNCLAADEEFKKIIEMAQDVKDKMKSAEITVKSQNDNDFRMEDGTLRTLNLLLTVDKNVGKSSEDQWNCQLTGVLEKKSGEEHNSSSLSVSSYENEGRCLHVTEQGGGQKTDTQIHEKDIEEGKQTNLIIKKEITKECESVFNKELTDTTACQCNTTKTEISSANERKERNLKNTEDISKEAMQTHENNTEEVHEKITIIKNNEEVILNTPIWENKSKSDNFDDFIKSGLQREDEKVEGSTLPAPVSSETQGIEEEDSNKKRKLEEDVRNEKLSDKSLKHLENNRNSFISSGSELDEEFSLNYQNGNSVSKYASFSEDDFSKNTLENGPEVFLTPLSSNTDIAHDTQENFGVFKNLSVLKLEINEKPKFPEFESVVEIKKEENNENRAFCELNEYPNSKICFDPKRNLKRVLETCETLGQKVEKKIEAINAEYEIPIELNVQKYLANSTKSPERRQSSKNPVDLKEIFIDLEKMGNSITNRSKEKSSKRVSELSKKNFVRDSPLFLGKKRIQNITHRMSSRFLNHEKNEPNIDFEMLNEIHDEIIEDEMLFKNDQDFRNEKSHGAKLVKENEGKAECRKKKHLKKSFYHQIVKKSEIGETKSRNTEKFSDKTILNKKKHEMDISKQKDDVKLKVNEECLNKGDISHQFHDSLSDKGFKVSDEQFFDANKSRELTIVGKLSDELNLQLKKDNKEQVVQDFQPEKEKKEKVLSDSEKSFTLPSRHKILKKFSSIEHKKDSSIITIRKNLKFDISKKQMCESETPKVVKVASQSKNTNILSPKVSSSSVSKPKNMILKLSPSKELYVPPLKSEKNDFDEIKQVLLKNPKKLMEAASKIMEKNEYLNFLLDLKSTKELTSYWWKKILNGLSSSRSLSNLLKLSKIGEQKLKDTRDARETTTKQIDAPQKDFLKSPNSIIEKLEKKTSLELEIENAKLKSTGNKKDSAGDKHILKRDDTHGGTSRRNLSLQHQDPSNFSEQQALPYTLVKYLETFESTIDLKNTERVRENSDTSDPQTACSEVCDEKSAIHVEEIKKNNSSSKISFDLSNETQEKEVKNIKGGDTELLEVPDDFTTNHENRFRVEDQLPPDFIYRSLGKIVEENEELKHPTTEQKYKHYLTKEIHKDLSEKSENSLHEAMEFSSTKARCEKTVRSNENAVASESRGSFTQKTAIVLPGREPFQISLISDETSATSRSSVRDKSEKNPLESLSDVLSNCSGPISSLSGKNVIRKKFMKKTNAKRIQKEDIRRATCSTTSSLGTDDSCRPLGKSVPISKQGNFQKRIPRKLDHSLKKPASQNEKSSASPHLPNVESFQNSDENRKIRVIQTKAFSEVLKEDPNLLNRLKERNLMWTKNREMSEQSPRRLEYRFHDFRRKENKSLELRARHLQQRKKDLLSKFKGLIQARKEASDRNRLSTPRVESDQLSPKVFSKIFEKINYFKGLEEKHVDEMSRAKVKNRSLIPTKIPNRRFIHTNHEQVNEDYLSTWVQEHPNVMVTKDKQESSPNCKADTENVIHVPWSPCGCVEGKN